MLQRKKNTQKNNKNNNNPPPPPQKKKKNNILTLVLLNLVCSAFANCVAPDQLASEEANWSGSTLFVIKYVNLYQNPGLSNLIGWKLEVEMAS